MSSSLYRFIQQAKRIAVIFDLCDYKAESVVAQASGALTWADLMRILKNQHHIPVPTDSDCLSKLQSLSIFSGYSKYRNQGVCVMSGDYDSLEIVSSNKIFLPNEGEKELIQSVQRYIRNSYSLVRLTFTMIDKSTIDASKQICKMLVENDVFDYETAVDGVKYYQHATVLSDEGVESLKTSFYRPKAKPEKKGDPRFWPWGLKKMVEEGTLIYITTFNGKLIIIPLTSECCSNRSLESVFGPIQSGLGLVKELFDKLKEFSFEWVKSCSPNKKSPKDVGDTLELLLGLSINNDGGADYKGAIELKAKRSSSKTADTLFSQVPDWELSPIKSVREMMLKYGYPSTHKDRQGYQDLFVTVSNEPNRQGLFLEVDHDLEQIVQYHIKDSKKEVTAIWLFEKLQARLEEKHPKTAWIIADEILIDGEYHFNYNKLELTQNPIFSQFLSLIEQGIVRYDWRGGHEVDGKGRVDKGHAFRLRSPKFRDELFGEREVISLVKDV